MEEKKMIRDANENGSWFNYDDVKGFNLLSLEDLKAALENEGCDIDDASFKVAVFVSDDKNEIAYAADTGYWIVYYENGIYTPAMSEDERTALEEKLEALMSSPATHIIIEVHNNASPRRFDIESFESAALADGDWSYQRFEDRAAAFEVMDVIPADLDAILDKGPAVWVTCSSYEKAVPVSKFDVEAEAEAYLASDVARLLVIDSAAAAEKIAASYTGPSQDEVREIARNLIEEFQLLK